jgi:predicted ATP-grasp superfamily ATP-dependent carboligase
MFNIKKVPKGPVKVLLADGHTRSGLAVARSLSRKGISFLVLTDDPHCLTFYSRFINYLLPAPSPKKNPEAFLEYTLEVIRKYEIPLVIPITDDILFFLDQKREIFIELTKIAMPDSYAVQSVLNKRVNLRLARELGIPCPKQFELKSSLQIPEMIKTLGFPIVLKNPGNSSERGVSPFNFRILYAHNEEELRGHISKHCQTGIYPIFQEYVSGEVHNLCCFAAQGEIIALHAYHSIRRWRGEGVLRKIIEPSSDLIKYACVLIQQLKWDGVAHIAFFVSKDRKKKWYMETNGRFWASTEGSIHAGGDFPYWVYKYFLYGEKPNPKKIKIGSKTCWHLGDLKALLNYIRGGTPPATGTHPAKICAILQYLSGFLPKIHSDVFCWNDPLPAVMEHLRFFKKIYTGIKKNLA